MATLKERASEYIKKKMELEKHHVLADYVDSVTAVRRGLVQAKKGAGRSVDEAFDDLKRNS